MTHRKNVDLKAQLAEAQLAAQNWEDKFIEAAATADASGCEWRKAEATIAELRAELGQCSRELLAVSAQLDVCRKERGEALDALHRLRSAVEDLDHEDEYLNDVGDFEVVQPFLGTAVHIPAPRRNPDESWHECEQELKAANARIAELERDRATLLTAEKNLCEERDELRRHLSAANARAEAAEGEQANLLADYKSRADECDKLESEAAALRAEVETERLARGQDICTLNAEVEKWKGLAHEECQRRSMVEVSRNELRAEVERLTARLTEQVASGDGWRTGQAAAENLCHVLSTSLAEARALLVRWDHLHSGAGAAERAPIERLKPRTIKLKPRTIKLDDDPVEAAERAVLDACRESDITTDHKGRPGIRGIDQVLVAMAELARRAVKS